MHIDEVVNTTAIEQFVQQVGVNKVFGAPTREGDSIVIPVAQVEFGFGYGGGFGSGLHEDAPQKEGQEAVANPDEDGGEGGGGGGGAGGRSTPRGYIHISPEGVKYTPIMDELRIPLGGMLVGAWSIFWITMAIRSIARAIVVSRQKVLTARVV